MLHSCPSAYICTCVPVFNYRFGMSGHHKMLFADVRIILIININFTYV